MTCYHGGRSTPRGLFLLLSFIPNWKIKTQVLIALGFVLGII